MRTGKLAEPVRKRSVLRQLKNSKAAPKQQYGTDRIFSGECGDQLMVTVAPDRILGFEGKPEKQVVAVSNSLEAAGVRNGTVLVQALLPKSYEEPELQNDMRQICTAASFLGLSVQAGQTEVSSDVKAAQYLMTGNGVRTGLPPQFAPGQALVLTKWIALGGTAALALRYTQELHSRFPFSMVDEAADFQNLMSVKKEAGAVLEKDREAAYALAQGGIFAALWELAEHAGVGLEIDLKRIPVRQETVELCEYFDVNPYELYSAGALLIGTYDAQALTGRLLAAGISAAVIGQITDGNDRIIRNGEDCRFLDRPKQDEWCRLAERLENEKIQCHRR